MRLVVCETVAAIVSHLRELAPGEEPLYTGHRQPRPKTLCGRGVGWDTRIPVDAVGCKTCREIVKGSAS